MEVSMVTSCPPSVTLELGFLAHLSSNFFNNLKEQLAITYNKMSYIRNAFILCVKSVLIQNIQGTIVHEVER